MSEQRKGFSDAQARRRKEAAMGDARVVNELSQLLRDEKINQQQYETEIRLYIEDAPPHVKRHAVRELIRQSNPTEKTLRLIAEIVEDWEPRAYQMAEDALGAGSETDTAMAAEQEAYATEGLHAIEQYLTAILDDKGEENPASPDSETPHE